MPQRATRSEQKDLQPDQTHRRAAAQRYLDVAASIFVEIDRQQRVTLINKQGCAVLGYPEADILGKNWFTHFIPEEQREAVAAIHRRLLLEEAEAPEWAENEVLTANGEQRNILWHNASLRNEQGQIIGTLSSGEDITEQRNAEQALAQAEARARAILETTVDAIITIDEQGIIETFNQAAETIFGYPAAEAIGQNVKILMPSPYREAHDGYMQAYHTTGEGKIIGIGREVIGQRKDGTVFPIDLAVSEVQLGDRCIFSSIIRDLSERKRLEREVLEVSAQEQQRIGQELHDGLGSHLTGVAMSCRALARRLEQGKPLKQEDIEEVAMLVQEGAQQARLLSRGLNPVKVSDQGLQTALQELAANMQKLSGIPCLFQRESEIPQQDAETTLHLYRIAQEAVNNALKHAKAEHIWIRLAYKAQCIVLTVEDDGRGLPASLENKEGIGRRVMQHRAHLIGATFKLEQAPGGGTRATCRLPLNENKMPASVSALNGPSP